MVDCCWRFVTAMVL